jgi:hypothetical protein
MSHLGSISGHELATGPAAVAAVKNLGTNAVLVSALGAVLELAGQATLPVAVRSLAALVTCGIAIAVVVWAFGQEHGQASARPQARRRQRPSRGRPGRSGDRSPPADQ